MNAKELFRAVVEDCEPTTILAAGRPARTAAEEWQADHPDTSVEPLTIDAVELAGSSARPHDLAIISEILDDMSPREGSIVLGQLRNFGNLQIAALVSNRSAWAFTDFIALGFIRQGSTEGEQGYTLYTYNIDNYNHKRAWNNPKNWANPEMWGKAWW